MEENLQSRIRRRFTADEKREAVEAFRRAGLSKNAFAKKVGVKWLTLDHWIRQSEEAVKSQWVSVRVVDSEAKAPEWPEFVNQAGVRLRVPPGVDAAALVPLLEALRRC